MSQGVYLIRFLFNYEILVPYIADLSGLCYSTLSNMPCSTIYYLHIKEYEEYLKQELTV